MEQICVKKSLEQGGLSFDCNGTTAQILDAHKSYDPATVHRMAFADASSRAKKHMDGAAALKQARSLLQSRAVSHTLSA